MTHAYEIPYIHDHHSHVSLYGALSDCPNILEMDVTEAWRLLREMPKDRLSLVLGWHSGRMPLHDKNLATLPPVVIVNLSLHGLRLSPAAAEILRSTDQELVERHLDPQWCERNLSRLLTCFGNLAGFSEEKLHAFMTDLERAGIQSTEDMLLTGSDAYGILEASPYAERIRCWTSPVIFQGLDARAQEGVHGLKLFLDGALGARTAAVGEPFLDGSSGLLCYTDAALQDELERTISGGKAVAIHAIGERAIEQGITVLEALVRDGASLPMVRLEHVQLIHHEQARRAKALGLILSMQPNFSSDSRDYADRLGPAQRAANNPFRMLIDRCGFKPGQDLIFGSDGMPHGVEYALQWSLFPGFAEQRLSLEEFFAGSSASEEGEMAGRVVIDEAARRVHYVPLG